MLECNVFDIMLQPVSSFLDCVINFWSFFEKVEGPALLVWLPYSVFAVSKKTKTHYVLFIF